MFGNDFKDRIIRYLEKFYEFSEKGKERLFEDDFFFLEVVCCNLKQLITELHYSVIDLRSEAVEDESVIIPIQMRLPVMKGDGIIWDLEKLYFLY